MAEGLAKVIEEELSGAVASPSSARLEDLKVQELPARMDDVRKSRGRHHWNRV